ncbi:GNAT family N-acetyltransferase [Fluviibacterium sp. DFM31]|uniref:GNAT family N-acetyltransferase n=1 Tax=Meridianimarinicoccus marinus TaxID=3231483 RepID=A0ABV3L3X4_9RHOB
MGPLTTERLILRRPAPDDWPTFQGWAMSDRAAMAGGRKDLGGAWRQFASVLGHWQIRGFGMWALTRPGDDTCFGMVGPWFPADWPETELGWILFDGAEGQGYASEAARAARRHAYDVLGWSTAVSYIEPDNLRSIAVAERLGATLDPQAAQPKPDTPQLVYRHPGPEGRA